MTSFRRYDRPRLRNPSLLSLLFKHCLDLGVGQFLRHLHGHLTVPLDADTILLVAILDLDPSAGCALSPSGQCDKKAFILHDGNGNRHPTGERHKTLRPSV